MSLHHLRIAQARMSQVLAESNEARGFSMRLQNVGVAGEIVADMKQHATWSAKAYELFQKLVAKNVNQAAVYQKIYARLDEKTAWYTLRKGAAKGIQQAMNKRPSGSEGSASKRRKAAGTDADSANGKRRAAPSPDGETANQ